MDNGISNPNLVMVHGEVSGQGQISGIRYGHAWIEDGDMVIDNSNNRNLKIPKMIYYSLAYSYKRKDQEIDFTIYDVNDWIDENGGIGGDFWNNFQKAFNDSMYKDVPVDNSKKKVNPTK
jgi:hypothetical protein